MSTLETAKAELDDSTDRLVRLVTQACLAALDKTLTLSERKHAFTAGAVQCGIVAKSILKASGEVGSAVKEFNRDV